MKELLLRPLSAMGNQIINPNVKPMAKETRKREARERIRISFSTSAPRGSGSSAPGQLESHCSGLTRLDGTLTGAATDTSDRRLRSNCQIPKANATPTQERDKNAL